MMDIYRKVGYVKANSTSLFTFILALVSITALQNYATDPQYKCGGAFDCWLDGIELDIPDECFNVIGMKCCSNHLICTHTTISSIKSGFSYPNHISFDVNGLHIGCKGEWRCGFISGKVTANVKNTEIVTVVEVEKANNLPVSMTCDSCSVPKMTVDLQFSGSVASDILDGFQSLLEQYVVSQVRKELCATFGDDLSKNGTALLVMIVDPAVSHLMSFGPSPAPKMPGQLSWNDSLLRVVDSYARHWLPGGLVGLVVDTLTDGTGSISVDLHNNSATIPVHQLSLVLPQAQIRQTPSATTGTESTLPSGRKNGGSLGSASSLAIPPHPVARAAEQPGAFLANISFVLHRLTVRHLDTIRHVSPLTPSPVSNLSLHSHLEASRLMVQLDTTLTVTPAVDGPAKGQLLEEAFTVTFLLRDVVVDLDMAVAVSEASLETLYLDQLLSKPYGACLLSTMNALSLSSLEINASIANISVSPDRAGGRGLGLEGDLDRLVNSTLLLLTREFREMLTGITRGLFQGPVRRYANQLLTGLLSQSRSVCPAHVRQNESHWVDWKAALNFVGSKRLQQFGPAFVNQVAAWRTGGSGTVSYDLVSHGHWSVLLSGLDSIFRLSVDPDTSSVQDTDDLYHQRSLVPSRSPVDNYFDSGEAGGKDLGGGYERWFAVDVPYTSEEDSHYLLKTQLSTGICVGQSCPSRAVFRNTSFVVSFKGKVKRTKVSIALSIGWLALSSTWKFLFNYNRLLNMRLLHISDFSCLATAIDEMKLFSSRQRAGMVDIIVDGEEVGPGSTEILNEVLKLASTPLIIQLINANIDAILALTTAQCPLDGAHHSYSPVSPPSTSSHKDGGDSAAYSDDGKADVSNKDKRKKVSSKQAETLSFLESFSVLMTATTIGMMVFILWWRYGDNAITNTPEEDEEEQEEDQQSPSPKKGAYCSLSLNSTSLAQYELLLEPDDPMQDSIPLVTHVELPLMVRVILPLLTIGTGWLFYWSNTSIGANVYLKATLGDIVVDSTDPIFQFSLLGTVHDMWKAKVYALAILIAFFSGLWPYVKLTGMLVSLFCAHNRWFDFRRRESLLVWLDCLAKWSLVDLFVLVLMISAFKLNVIVSEYVQFDVHVEPKVGFYTFLVATICSLMLGHLVLACHRQIFRTPILAEISTGDETAESVSKHTFIFRRRGTPDETPNTGAERSNWLISMYSIPPAMSIFVIGVLLVLLALIVAGVSLDSFQFIFRGLVGYFLKERHLIKYSFLKSVEILPQASSSSSPISIGFIQTSVLLFGVIMPILNVATLLLLWVKPMSMQYQYHMIMFGEMFNAWSALDVFAVSIAVAVLEIHQFANFMIGDACDDINALLRSRPSSDAGQNDDITHDLRGSDHCFDVQASLTHNCWPLFLAALILAVLGPVFLRLANKALEERIALTRMVKKWKSKECVDLLDVVEGCEKPPRTLEFFKD